jgi:hypothetical protein
MKRSIIRNLQPNDLVVITAPANILTQQVADQLSEVTKDWPCIVAVMPDTFTVGSKRHHWWQR